MVPRENHRVVRVVIFIPTARISEAAKVAQIVTNDPRDTSR
jgi:hypothetical protein